MEDGGGEVEQRGTAASPLLGTPEKLKPDMGLRKGKGERMTDPKRSEMTMKSAEHTS